MNFKLCNDRATASAESGRAAERGARLASRLNQVYSNGHITWALPIQTAELPRKPPPPDHRRFIIKAICRATSEDCGKDSHGVSRFRLDRSRLFCLSDGPSRREGGGGRARTNFGTDAFASSEGSAVVERVRSDDVSHGKPLPRPVAVYSAILSNGLSPMIGRTERARTRTHSFRFNVAVIAIQSISRHPATVGLTGRGESIGESSSAVGEETFHQRRIAKEKP